MYIVPRLFRMELRGLIESVTNFELHESCDTTTWTPFCLKWIACSEIPQICTTLTTFQEEWFSQEATFPWRSKPPDFLLYWRIPEASKAPFLPGFSSFTRGDLARNLGVHSKLVCMEKRLASRGNECGTSSVCIRLAWKCALQLINPWAYMWTQKQIWDLRNRYNSFINPWAYGRGITVLRALGPTELCKRHFVNKR